MGRAPLSRPVALGVACSVALFAGVAGAQATYTVPDPDRDREGGLFIAPPERPESFSDTSIFDVLEPEGVIIEEEPLEWQVDPEPEALEDPIEDTTRSTLPGYKVAPETPPGAITPEIVRRIPTEPVPYVRIRELDKMTGRTLSHTVAVGGAIDLGRVFVEVDACEAPPGGELEGTRAFLRIWDRKYAREAADFSGWMFADSPALSAFDHPRFDVWVISCTTSAGEVASGSE